MIETTRNKITAEMSFEEYPFVVIEGYPGVATVIRSINEALRNEPEPSWCKGRVWSEPLWYLMRLDDLGIRGPLLWLLYKDVCKMSTKQTMACIVATMGPMLDSEVLYNFVAALSLGGDSYHIAMNNKPFDPEEILKAVTKHWKS